MYSCISKNIKKEIKRKYNKDAIRKILDFLLCNQNNLIFGKRQGKTFQNSIFMKDVSPNLSPLNWKKQT